MIWTTWRQHRLEGAWALALGAALAAAVGFVAYQLHAAACPGVVNDYCLRNDIGGQIAQKLIQYNLYQYGLVVLPALAGAFIGCPLVAREIENSTHRLAWTQGVTRLRWLATKLALTLVPLSAIALGAGLLETVLIRQMGSAPSYWAFYDQQAPMTVAAIVFAVALGVAIGAVVGRSVPAMAGMLVAYVAVRIGLAEFARPNFIAPLTYKDVSGGFTQPYLPGVWWVDQSSFYDASGRLLGNSGGLQPTPGQVAYAIQHYQPADRFWQFQTIESLILALLAVALMAFATYWVTRRVG